MGSVDIPDESLKETIVSLFRSMGRRARHQTLSRLMNSFCKHCGDEMEDYLCPTCNSEEFGY